MQVEESEVGEGIVYLLLDKLIHMFSLNSPTVQEGGIGSARNVVLPPSDLRNPSYVPKEKANAEDVFLDVLTACLHGLDLSPEQVAESTKYIQSCMQDNKRPTFQLQQNLLQQHLQQQAPTQTHQQHPAAKPLHHTQGALPQVSVSIEKRERNKQPPPSPRRGTGPLDLPASSPSPTWVASSSASSSSTSRSTIDKSWSLARSKELTIIVRTTGQI